MTLRAFCAPLRTAPSSTRPRPAQGFHGSRLNRVPPPYLSSRRTPCDCISAHKKPGPRTIALYVRSSAGHKRPRRRRDPRSICGHFGQKLAQRPIDVRTFWAPSARSYREKGHNLPLGACQAPRAWRLCLRSSTSHLATTTGSYRCYHR